MGRSTRRGKAEQPRTGNCAQAEARRDQIDGNATNIVWCCTHVVANIPTFRAGSTTDTGQSFPYRSLDTLEAVEDDRPVASFNIEKRMGESVAQGSESSQDSNQAARAWHRR